LDDVEADLAQEAEAGVAGPDVVGRETHAGAATGIDVLPQLIEVLHALSLGQLEDDLVERDPVAVEDRLELADPAQGRLQRPRRFGRVAWPSTGRRPRCRRGTGARCSVTAPLTRRSRPRTGRSGRSGRRR